MYHNNYCRGTNQMTVFSTSQSHWTIQIRDSNFAILFTLLVESACVTPAQCPKWLAMHKIVLAHPYCMFTIQTTGDLKLQLLEISNCLYGALKILERIPRSWIWFINYSCADDNVCKMQTLDRTCIINNNCNMFFN